MMLLAVVVLGMVAGGGGQQAAETVRFRLARPGAPVPSYTLTVAADGSATYEVSYPPVVPKYSPYAASLSKLPNTEVTIKTNLSASGTASLFEKLRAAKDLNGGCASKAKNIADTGAKTLTYTGPAGTATCTYNYTEEKNVASLTNTFQAIAFTLDEGRKLEQEHRFDRLALDPETDHLVTAAKDGDAVEFGAIGSALREIAGDPQVLERVRMRATKLLEQAAEHP